MKNKTKSAENSNKLEHWLVITMMSLSGFVGVLLFTLINQTWTAILSLIAIGILLIISLIMVAKYLATIFDDDNENKNMFI